MIYVFGNCQASNIARLLAPSSRNVEFRWIHSPSFFRLHQGCLGNAFHRQVSAHGIPLKFLRAGVAYPWRAPLTPQDPAPWAMVFTLFPEQQLLYVDKTYGNGVYLNPTSLKKFPSFGQWVDEHFEAMRFDPKSYLRRFMQMLSTARQLHPKTQLVVVARSRHVPAYGPNPFSLNTVWNDRGLMIASTLEQFSRDDDKIHLLDVDRLIAADLEQQPDIADCLYPQITFQDGDPDQPRRDMEHATDTLWSQVAGATLELLTSGKHPGVGRADLDALLNKPYAPYPDKGRLLELLVSGCRLKQARALASMILDSKDHGELLARHAGRLILRPQVVTTLCAYARKKHNPLLHKVHAKLLASAKARLAKEGNALWFERFTDYLDGFKRIVEQATDSECAGAEEPMRALP